MDDSTQPTDPVGPEADPWQDPAVRPGLRRGHSASSAGSHSSADPSSVTGPNRSRSPGRTTRSSRSRRTPVRRRVDREALADLSDLDLDPALSPPLQALWDTAAEDSRRWAARCRALERFWREPDPVGEDEGIFEADVVAVALALRCTNEAAAREIHDAHHALHLLPLSFARLQDGQLPLGWFQRLLRRTRQLNHQQVSRVDAEVAGWPSTLTTEQFRRRLSSLLTRIESETTTPYHHTAEGRRRVELLPPGEDGMGCLQVIGPIPEILGLARRLDSAARAVQSAQRHALEAGGEIPCDRDDDVAETGLPSSLRRLQYDLLTGTALDTGEIRVPADRFRLTVTVPALTLLGASVEPGMLDGRIPVPASMARELAGASRTWYRVLTDPASGEFLPLPAERYAPSPAMLEHLRLRNVTCAAPGCTRSTSWASEADHIQEYDHADPEAGGLTRIENLHLLCWQHHRLKTAGLLDPVRMRREPGAPGATVWTGPGSFRTLISDDTDLATPSSIAELTAAWEDFQTRWNTRHHPPDPPPSRDPQPSEPPPF